MSENEPKMKFPELPLKIRGLDRDCDVSSLAVGAEGIAVMLEQMGTCAQREDAPLHLYDWRKAGGRS